MKKDSDDMDTNPKKRFLPPAVRSAIEYALKQARMDVANCAIDEEHKQAMKLYLDSWVAGPLSQVIEWDDGNLPARSIARW